MPPHLDRARRELPGPTAPHPRRARSLCACPRASLAGSIDAAGGWMREGDEKSLPGGSVGPQVDDHFQDHAESRFELLLCLEAQLLNLLGGYLEEPPTRF